jgi:hypothetical protein
MSTLFGDGRDSLGNFHDNEMHEAGHGTAGESGGDMPEAAGNLFGGRIGGEMLEEDSLKMWWRRIHQSPC